MEQDFVRSSKRLFYCNPILERILESPTWNSGDLYFAQRKLSTRWKPGSILAALSNQGATRTSRGFRQTPDRGLADMLRYWTIDLMNSNYRSSVELMLSLSLLLGLLAFWEFSIHFRGGSNRYLKSK